MKDALGRVQSVLVLGGGSEIGLATAGRLVARGARRVVLLARDPEAVRRAAAPLADAGAEVITMPFDAAATETHAAVVDQAFAQHGDFDVVLLAFGVLGDQAAFEGDPAAAARAAIVNYAGGVSSGLAVARRLREQGHGTLVVLSSVAGQRPRRENYVYGSSKAGLDALAIGIGEALRGSGAGVMVVRPGFVRSAMTRHLPVAPFAQTPGQVADAIVAGLDRGATVVWVPGLLRWLFLALRALPSALFRMLRP